jgi:hypothetical protein
MLCAVKWIVIQLEALQLSLIELAEVYYFRSFSDPYLKDVALATCLLSLSWGQLKATERMQSLPK